MRFISAVTITMLASSLVACATEGVDPADPTDELDEPAVENIAACYLPAQPPSPSHTFTMDAHDWPDIFQVHDYGTSECSNVTSEISGLGQFMAQVTQHTNDPDTCVHTSINVVRWYKPSGLPQGSPPWAHLTPVTVYGEWTANGCKNPVYEIHQGGTYRYQVKAARRTCAGQFCGTQYGFPFLQTAAYSLD